MNNKRWISTFLFFCTSIFLFMGCSNINTKVEEPKIVMSTYSSKVENEKENIYITLKNYMLDNNPRKGVQIIESNKLNSNGGYKESMKFYKLFEAMIDLEEGKYGKAREQLVELGTFENSKELIKKIDEKISNLNGVYKSKTFNYGVYIVINNGKVALDVTDNILDTKVKLSNYLSKHTFTTGKEAFKIDSPTGETMYILQKNSKSNPLIVAAPEGAEFATFSGAYYLTDIPEIYFD